MDARNFDRLTRLLAVGTNRRGAMKTLVASALGGVGLAKAMEPAGAADAPGEAWVQLLEEMAELVRSMDADCATIGQELQAFRSQHSADVERMRLEVEAWTAGHFEAHVTAYGDRIRQASSSLMASMIFCGYKPDSVSPYSVADYSVDDDGPGGLATPAGKTSGNPIAYLGGGARVNALQPSADEIDCYDDCKNGTLITAQNCYQWYAAFEGSGGGDRQAMCFTILCNDMELPGYDWVDCNQKCYTCVELN